MRQDDDIERDAGALGAMQSSDDAAQFRLSDQLLRRERADCDHEFRLQKADLAIEMRAAVRDLDRTRYAIAGVRRIPSRKTADDCAAVNRIAKRRPIDAAHYAPTANSLPRGA